MSRRKAYDPDNILADSDDDSVVSDAPHFKRSEVVLSPQDQVFYDQLQPLLASDLRFLLDRIRNPDSLHQVFNVIREDANDWSPKLQKTVCGYFDGNGSTTDILRALQKMHEVVHLKNGYKVEGVNPSVWIELAEIFLERTSDDWSREHSGEADRFRSGDLSSSSSAEDLAALVVPSAEVEAYRPAASARRPKPEPLPQSTEHPFVSIRRWQQAGRLSPENELSKLVATRDAEAAKKKAAEKRRAEKMGYGSRSREPKPVVPAKLKPVTDAVIGALVDRLENGAVEGNEKFLSLFATQVKGDSKKRLTKVDSERFATVFAEVVFEHDQRLVEDGRLHLDFITNKELDHFLDRTFQRMKNPLQALTSEVMETVIHRAIAQRPYMGREASVEDYHPVRTKNVEWDGAVEKQLRKALQDQDALGTIDDSWGDFKQRFSEGFIAFLSDPERVVTYKDKSGHLGNVKSKQEAVGWGYKNVYHLAEDGKHSAMSHHVRIVFHDDAQDRGYLSNIVRRSLGPVERENIVQEGNAGLDPSPQQKIQRMMEKSNACAQAVSGKLVESIGKDYPDASFLGVREVSSIIVRQLESNYKHRIQGIEPADFAKRFVLAFLEKAGEIEEVSVENHVGLLDDRFFYDQVPDAFIRVTDSLLETVPAEHRERLRESLRAVSLERLWYAKDTEEVAQDLVGSLQQSLAEVRDEVIIAKQEKQQQELQGKMRKHSDARYDLLEGRSKARIEVMREPYSEEREDQIGALNQSYDRQEATLKNVHQEEREEIEKRHEEELSAITGPVQVQMEALGECVEALAEKLAPIRVAVHEHMQTGADTRRQEMMDRYEGRLRREDKGHYRKVPSSPALVQSVLESVFEERGQERPLQPTAGRVLDGSVRQVVAIR